MQEIPNEKTQEEIRLETAAPEWSTFPFEIHGEVKALSEEHARESVSRIRSFIFGDGMVVKATAAIGEPLPTEETH